MVLFTNFAGFPSKVLVQSWTSYCISLSYLILLHILPFTEFCWFFYNAFPVRLSFTEMASTTLSYNASFILPPTQSICSSISSPYSLGSATS